MPVYVLFSFILQLTTGQMVISRIMEQIGYKQSFIVSANRGRGWRFERFSFMTSLVFKAFAESHYIRLLTFSGLDPSNLRLCAFISLLYFRKENNSVRDQHSVGVSLKIWIKLTDFYEISYERHAIVG